MTNVGWTGCPRRSQGGARCPRAKGKQIETEAAPIRCVAELIGAETDSECAIRWLIALMVLCCDHNASAASNAAGTPIAFFYSVPWNDLLAGRGFSKAVIQGRVPCTHARWISR
jgi:hypothetical protein